jgi:hypothetical protein
MMHREFASVAEAGAHYYALGYRTVHETNNEIYERVMQAGDHFVCIRKLGLLHVVAIEE